MNLWVKRTGQLLLAALFLIACEDDSFLLGFKNQNKKFNVGYQEFYLEDDEVISKVISLDSIITDNLSNGTRRLLVGDYIDPIIGSVRAESFAEFTPSSTTKLDGSETLEYEFDSLVLQMRLDYYSYGLVNEGISNFKVHRITEDTLSYVKPFTYQKDGKDTTVLIFNRYYANSSIGYNEAEYLGETRLVKLNRVKGKEKYTNTVLKLSRLEAGQDTLLARARLDDVFGNELFDVAEFDANSEFSNSGKFRSRFKGFALIPSESNSVLGYNPQDLYTRLILYYHSTDNGNVKDTLNRIFYPGVNFHRITPTRTAELPNPDPAYTGVNPASGLRVVQGGNPLVTKIDLTNFYKQFADTVSEDVIINSAEVLIQGVPSQTGYKPISNFELRVMKENDRYADYRISEDSAFVSGFSGNTLLPQSLHYFVLGDLIGGTSVLSYSSSKEKYSGFATLFFQSLLDRVVENKKTPDSPKPNIRYLGVYPLGEMGKSINRTVFNKGDIKLRIYYTYPNKTNL